MNGGTNVTNLNMFHKQHQACVKEINMCQLHQECRSIGAIDPFLILLETRKVDIMFLFLSIVYASIMRSCSSITIASYKKVNTKPGQSSAPDSYLGLWEVNGVTLPPMIILQRGCLLWTRNLKVLTA